MRAKSLLFLSYSYLETYIVRQLFKGKRHFIINFWLPPLLDIVFLVVILTLARSCWVITQVCPYNIELGHKNAQKIFQWSLKNNVPSSLSLFKWYNYFFKSLKCVVNMTVFFRIALNKTRVCHRWIPHPK